MWSCQLAGHSGRSGWALTEEYQGPWFSGAPLKLPLPQRDPPAPTEAEVATGGHQLCCPPGGLTHLDTTVGARRAWGAAGRGAGVQAGAWAGRLGRGLPATCGHQGRLGPAPLLGGPEAASGTTPWPTQSHREGRPWPRGAGRARGHGVRRGPGASRRCVLCGQWAALSRGPCEGARGTIRPWAPELSPAGGGPGSRQSPGPGALTVAPGPRVERREQHRRVRAHVCTCGCAGRAVLSRPALLCPPGCWG